MSDTTDDLDLDPDIYVYIMTRETCKFFFCGGFIYEEDNHQCLDANMMRQIIDGNITWLMKHSQMKREKQCASNSTSCY